MPKGILNTLNAIACYVNQTRALPIYLWATTTTIKTHTLQFFKCIFAIFALIHTNYSTAPRIPRGDRTRQTASNDDGNIWCLYTSEFWGAQPLFMCTQDSRFEAYLPRIHLNQQQMRQTSNATALFRSDRYSARQSVDILLFSSRRQPR